MVSTTTPNLTTTVPNMKQVLTLQCKAVNADTTAIRSLDWNRSRFDIEFGLRNGTTYNSFLVQGAHIALIDTSHAKFRDIWLDQLKKQIDIQENKLESRANKIIDLEATCADLGQELNISTWKFIELHIVALCFVIEQNKIV